MQDGEDKLLIEARAILAPQPDEPTIAQQLDEQGDPASVAKHLAEAREHLARASAGMRALCERKVVPAGISGGDAVRAESLVSEVDRLIESVANYYA